MGTGLISFGSPPGTLQVAGSSTILTLGSNPVVITPGASQTARISGRAIIIDNALLDSPEQFCAYSSAALSTLPTLAKWYNKFRQSGVYVRKLEANFATPQTTADPANYYRLRVNGSAGGNALLPLTAVSPSFVLDQGFGAVLDKGLNSYLGVGNSNATALSQIATAFRFTVSQTQTLTGMSVAQGIFLGVSGFGGFTGAINPDAVRIRGQILDANGNALATAYTAALASNKYTTPMFWAFTRSVQLTPGNNYFFAFDIIEDYPLLTGGGANSNYYGLNFAISDTQTNGTDGGAFTTGTGSGSYSCVVGFQAPPSNDGYTTAAMVPNIHAFTWPAIVAGTQPMPYVDLKLIRGDGTVVASGPAPNWPRTFPWQANGSPSGLAIVSGDLTFTLDTVGAPIASAIGSGLNIHAVLSPS